MKRFASVRAVRWRTLVVAWSALAAVLFFPATGWGQQEDNLPVAILEGEEAEGVSWPNYICELFFTCPSTLSRKGNGNYVGCAKTPGSPACTGNCQGCSGSSTPALLCIFSPTDTCIPSGGGVVNCGTIVLYNNACIFGFGLLPPGEGFATPNGCYCNKPLPTATITTDACNVENCT